MSRRLRVCYQSPHIIQARETEKREQDMEAILELQAANDALQQKLHTAEETSMHKIGWLSPPPLLPFD